MDFELTEEPIRAKLAHEPEYRFNDFNDWMGHIWSEVKKARLGKI